MEGWSLGLLFAWILPCYSMECNLLSNCTLGTTLDAAGFEHVWWSPVGAAHATTRQSANANEDLVRYKLV